MLIRRVICCFFFFFQAEDGIRDVAVTGVQTCALPICHLGDRDRPTSSEVSNTALPAGSSTRTKDCALPRVGEEPAGSTCATMRATVQIGRASCRERV